MDNLSPSLLLLDLPEHALCGIDLLSFTTTPSFRGIKSLPPGLHFVFTAPHSTLAIRHGAWLSIPEGVESPPPLILKQWDRTTETLQPVTDPASVLSHRANLGGIWKTGMTPYRQRASDLTTPRHSSSADRNTFAGLTTHITPAYLSHVFALPEEKWHLTSYTDLVYSTDSSHSQLPPDLDPPLHLLPIDLRRTWPANATGRERTLAALDKSWYVESLATSHPLSTASSPLGPLTPYISDLEFSFLTTLTLNNASTLLHWRTLLRLVLGAPSAVPSHGPFFVAFLHTLTAQMQRLGTDALLDPPPPAPSREAVHGRVLGEAKNGATEMEDKTEDELLRYDLPVRGQGRKGRGRKVLEREAAEDEEMAAAARARADDEARAARDGAGDELRTLFLEDDVDELGRSFLVALLVGFRRNLRHGGEHVKGVLAALSGLEGVLFEMYGWEFDEDFTASVSGQGRSGLSAVDDGDEDGDGDEDEDGEYAPAVVDLTQDQMDALGIQGTPSGKSEKIREREPGPLGGGVVSQVVVEESDDEDDGNGDDGDMYAEDDLDETMDIEDMDARY